MKTEIIKLIKENADEETASKMVKYIEILEEDSNWLGCLENAGVDNWQGIDFAAELLREQNG